MAADSFGSSETSRWLYSALAATLLLTAACAPQSTASGDVSSPIISPARVAHSRDRFPQRLVVIEASWAPASEARDYLAGHIPGAVHVNTDVFENGSPRWHLRPVPELHTAIGELGIAQDSIVVVYGKQTVAAARVWWILEYAGVKDVRFLNGGFEAWKRAGYPVETTPNTPRPLKFEAAVREGIVATTDYVREHPEAILADVRSDPEYRGKVSGYSYLAAKGRIPGARHAGNAGSSAIYQNPDGTLRRDEEIRKLWQAAGLLDGSGREIIFYCGSGWRSSLAFLYARRMGLKGIRNYSDGWSGWSTIYELTPQQGWGQRPSLNPVHRESPP